ncbi:hypothetical protein Plhal304r1_c083g0167871 [Plasmopara halstedii]
MLFDRVLVWLSVESGYGSDVKMSVDASDITILCLVQAKTAKEYGHSLSSESNLLHTLLTIALPSII